MRRTLIICRTGLAGAAAVALLAACGGTDSSNASSSSSSSSTSSSASDTTSSSAASGTGPAAGTAFCQQAGAALSQLSDLGSNADPTTLGPVLQQAAAQLQAIDPPAEISNDWTTLVGAFSQLAQAASTTNFADAEQLAAFEQNATQLESAAGSAETNVDTYLQDQCGLDTSDDSSDSSAPTS